MSVFPDYSVASAEQGLPLPVVSSFLRAQNGVWCRVDFKQLHAQWASLVAQMVKDLPAVQETWARSLGWEDPLGEGMATRSSFLAWRIPMDRGAWWATVHEVAKSWT